ncbi:LysR family transcriptional regulator [Corallococcus exiguus]|uniref:LysR family transcriptional regulator n=1 Tax=Corallococcus exiguus TaxID=83462 RepID=UPI001471222A|nr:LysR family transcriptional regulator [Corallococcus exiguus]NNB87452.1 LysR family transcriptional regulator [Corallococcus exiguus]NNB94189.1 LysR family transcriptional regulator [Corallococcus exiguus]NNC03512.1 LysR family transcriptional regulator [Corallococcus exiguus]
MDLNELLIFARVVQAGSFTAAAKALRMPKSTVSRKVSELEERVGAQLLQRTTRTLHLTEVGRAYYAHCERIVAEAEAAELAVTRLQAGPYGLLRVTTPLSVHFLAPLVARFMEKYPDVQVELLCTDRAVDLLEEGFDLAVRAGRLPDSSLMARRLGDIEWLVVASPGYLQARGAPKTPADLAKHDCLFFGKSVQGNVWTLHAGGRSVDVKVSGRLVVNEPDMLRAVTSLGAGVALIPGQQCIEDLASGRLQRVLPDWSSTGAPVHAVYPPTRHHVPKVMAFVEVLREHWPHNQEAFKRAKR